MRPALLAIALLLLPAAAPAGGPADDLRNEIEKLKEQIDKLSKAARPVGVKIGAVNIVRVFDELEEKIDMSADIRQLEEKGAARLKELGARIRSLEDAAKLLNPNSEKAKGTAKLLEDAKSEFRTYRDVREDDLYNKLFDFTRSIYNKIRDEVQAYAREGGYDIVLRTRDPELGDLDEALRPRMRHLELNRRIEARTLLFHRPAFDFTDGIIKRLNEKYLRVKAEKRKLQTPDSTSPKPKE